MDIEAGVPDPSDEHLAEIAARRDTGGTASRESLEAFLRLYDRHARRLAAFLSSQVPEADREDVHQEAWLSAWNGLPDGFHGGNFRAWLYTITRNLVTDWVRRRHRRPWSSDADPDARPDPRGSDPVAGMIERERKMDLERCLKKLDAASLSVIRARTEGLVFREIGPRLGLSPRQANTLYHRAVNFLKGCVGGGGR
ncbi:MAG: sigma-70 family RNA polymerase sigma factor [Singulisphaera sp.]